MSLPLPGDPLFAVRTMTAMNPISEASAQVPLPAVQVQVRMTQPWTHYFEVSVKVSRIVQDHLDFVMPVWTPGSYLVREYARNVEEFCAEDGSGKALGWLKTDKNSWRVESNGASEAVVRYRVYAFERSVRASFLDDSHGFINGASVFMYPDGHPHIPYTVTICPYAGWDTISTGLDPVAGESNTFLAPDFDTLVDCPIEIGNQKVLDLEIRGVPHSVALSGEGNYDPDRLRADIGSIVDAAAEIVGEIPYSRYTFLIQLAAEGDGGLEHANSASLIVSRWTFRPEESYRRFLGLVSHEFFHVWNVKRIRPRELGPFDYTRENYSRLLWVSEGFTDYYGDLILRRAGLITADQYLELLSKTIQNYHDSPGRTLETPAQASFDAWIKFYRQDAHSPNATVSYYTKGALIALALDLEIRHRSVNQRSLDDVMRLLFDRYYKGLERGFDEDEFRAACEEIAGEPLGEIFAGYAYGTGDIDFARYLGLAGLRLGEARKGGQVAQGAYLGANVRAIDGKIVIVALPKGGPAYDQGLNLDDEIIAVDGYRAGLDWLQTQLEEKAPGTTVRILVSRAGKLRTIKVALGAKTARECRVEKVKEATPIQEELYESWLRASWR